MLYYRAEYQFNSVERQVNTQLFTTIIVDRDNEWLLTKGYYIDLGFAIVKVAF